MFLNKISTSNPNIRITESVIVDIYYQVPLKSDGTSTDNHFFEGSNRTLILGEYPHCLLSAMLTLIRVGQCFEAIVPYIFTKWDRYFIMITNGKPTNLL